MSNPLLEQLKEATEKKLSGDFVLELIKCCFTHPKIFDICRQHLKYHFLASEPQKKVYKYLLEHFDVHQVVPTLGIVANSFPVDKEVLSLLSAIKKVDVPNESIDSIISTFENFIKKSRFLALFNKTTELYNQGKHDEAIEEQAKEAAEIVSFTLKNKYYTRIFGDYDQRVESRQKKSIDRSARYCCWGIHELDDITRGIECGRSVLLMARSGGGKSTAMKWIGLANARQGKRVVHFQAEGTEDECKTAYDAAWTGCTLDDMEMGSIPVNQQFKIKKAHKDILGGGGEIYVYAAETFDSLSIEAAREIMQDIRKIHGEIDLAIFDYLPKFTVSGSFKGEQGERRRRLAIGDKITNIAVEFKCAAITAVQADDVKAEQYNKPDFAMKRGNISENKSQAEPFSYFITINQTDDEYENGIARLYIDKARKCKRGGTVKIYQALDRARFYDSVKTIQHFYTQAA